MECVYNLAGDICGMGFIELHKAECMLIVLINTHLLLAARDAKLKRKYNLGAPQGVRGRSSDNKLI